MKTTHIILTGISIAIATSMTAYAEGDQRGQGKGDPGKGGSRKGPPPEMIKQFDKDGDGKLSEDERKEARAAMEKRREEGKAKMLKRFDADGDGELSEDERKKMRETMDAKRKEVRAAVLKEFDANGNGKIDEDEREGVREWIKKNYPNAAHMRPHRGGKDGKGGRKGGKGGKGGKRGEGGGKGAAPAGE
jgi:Ca2+-binding EF-hand superfamily protein